VGKQEGDCGPGERGLKNSPCQKKEKKAAAFKKGSPPLEESVELGEREPDKDTDITEKKNVKDGASTLKTNNSKPVFGEIGAGRGNDVGSVEKERSQFVGRK